MALSTRIHIFGASGSGTTTLGLAIAEHLNIPHLDTDEYYWKKTEPPFTEKNTPERRIEMIEAEVVNAKSWTLSGSICSWGDPLLPNFNLAVFLQLNSKIRMQRLEQREAERYGNRIEPSGDMFQKHIEFMSWAESYDHAKAPIRSLDLHQSWMKSLSCPILELDSIKPVEALVHEVIQSAA